MPGILSNVCEEFVNAIEENWIAESTKDAKRFGEHFLKQGDEVFADSINKTS